MISKTIRENGRNYLCDDCRKVIDTFKSYDQARAAGWAISYDRQKCYCPACAPFRRNVGHTGERRKTVQIRIDSKNGELSDRV